MAGLNKTSQNGQNQNQKHFSRAKRSLVFEWWVICALKRQHLTEFYWWLLFYRLSLCVKGHQNDKKRISRTMLWCKQHISFNHRFLESFIPIKTRHFSRMCVKHRKQFCRNCYTTKVKWFKVQLIIINSFWKCRNWIWLFGCSQNMVTNEAQDNETIRYGKLKLCEISFRREKFLQPLNWKAIDIFWIYKNKAKHFRPNIWTIFLFNWRHLRNWKGIYTIVQSPIYYCS